MGSRYMNDFTRYGRNFRVVAQADTSYRMDIESLKQYYVHEPSGRIDSLKCAGNLQCGGKPCGNFALQPFPFYGSNG